MMPLRLNLCFARATRIGAAVLSLASLTPLVVASPEKATPYYEDALRRYEKNDLAGTIVQLKNALQEDKKMLAANLLLGKVLLKNGELKAAEVALEEATRQGVSRAEVLVPLGQVYLAMGDPKKLIDTINTQGLPATMTSEILTLRGSAFAMSGEFLLAEKSLDEARAADPKSALPLIVGAPLLVQKGEREKGRAMAALAVELAPNNPGAWFVQASIQQTLGDVKSALASFDKAIALNPKLVDARTGRAALFIGLGRDSDAEPDMAQLRAWGIVDPRVSFLRALLAKRRGDTQSARAEYAAVVNLIDSVPAAVRSNSEMLLMSGALSHRALGNQEKAREYLEALLARNARSFSAQLMLASVLVDTREYGRAMTVLETLRVAAPDEPNVLFLIASVYSARKQYVQAAELFERSARANPGGDAVRELALSQIGLGQDKTALANLEKAYAQNPRDQRAGTELAVSYARLGQADKAVQTAEAIVKGDPDNLAMLNFLGTTKGLVGDLAGAKSIYEKALAKDPLFRPSAINLNWMDIDAGRLDVARPRLQKLLLQKADDAELLFQLGVLESKARKPQAAIDAWTKANDVPRTDPRAGMALIDLYASQRMNDKVLALAKGLAARFPGSVGIQLALARASFAGGDAALGRGALVEATRLAAFDSTQQVLIGRTQLQYGNTEGALLNARKALESRPDDRDALVLMVEIEAKRNNATAVNAALKNLTARHPDSPATQLATGGVAMSRGQFPAAVTAFRAALAKDPNPQTAVMLSQALIANKEGEKAQSLLTDWAAKRPNDVISLQALSEVQMYLGNSAAARSTYAKIVALEPENPAAQANYAVLLLRLNDPTAVAAAEKAYRLAPSNPDYADVYGWLLALQGRAEAAVPVLREARLRDPGNGNLRYHLAFALQAAGRKVEAKEELGAVLGGPAKMPITPEVMKLKAELGL